MLNGHHSKQAFHELYNVARELQAKAQADPLQNCASLVASAIRTIEQFQMDADEIAAQKREKAELIAHNARVKTENQKLLSENLRLESTNDQLQEDIERQGAVLQDLNLQVGLTSGGLQHPRQPRPAA